MNARGYWGHARAKQGSSILCGAALMPVLALLVAPTSPALAQEANDAVDSFRLPPGAPATPAAPVVAPAAPVVGPTSPPQPEPAATPTATPAPSPAASPTTSPTTSPSPRPEPAASPSPGAVRSPAPAPTPTPARAPVTAATPTVSPAATATADPLAPPPVLPQPIEAAPTPPAPIEPADQAPARPWLLGLGAILAAGAALWLLRRRRRDVAEPAQPAIAEPLPPSDPSPPAALPKQAPAAPRMPEPALSVADAPSPAPALPKQAPPAPAPSAEAPPNEAAPLQAAPAASLRKASDLVAVALTARRLSATLMNTALTYELTITNTGPEAIGPIAVSGDMIGAHASIPPRVLLETAADGEPHHRIPRLEPGESAAMSGELRLPLAAITPIRHGTAALFVPLARFRVLVFREGRPPASANHAFVVGEDPQSPGAALKPFRLDLGPRLYSGITQRELALPS